MLNKCTVDMKLEHLSAKINSKEKKSYLSVMIFADKHPNFTSTQSA